MEVNISSKMREFWQQTRKQLNGQTRRLFMALVITDIGRGGAAWAKRELGWDRTPVRKGLHELESGVVCLDNVRMCGRKGFSSKLPQLDDDLCAIGEASSQTDPTFRTTQLYRRLTAAEGMLRCARFLDQEAPESGHEIQQTKKAIYTRVQGPGH